MAFQKLAPIANRRVGNRPNRVEPRAIKRRPKSHKLLTQPRDEARAELGVLPVSRVCFLAERCGRKVGADGCMRDVGNSESSFSRHTTWTLSMNITHLCRGASLSLVICFAVLHAGPGVSAEREGPQAEEGARHAGGGGQAEQDERRQFQAQELITAQSGTWIFKPGDTPRIVWRDAEEVQRLGGDARLRVRWFDAQLNEFPAPDESGRWLAWIEGTAPNGTPFRRGADLLRTAQGTPQFLRPRSDRRFAALSRPERPRRPARAPGGSVPLGERPAPPHGHGQRERGHLGGRTSGVPSRWDARRGSSNPLPC